MALGFDGTRLSYVCHPGYHQWLGCGGLCGEPWDAYDLMTGVLALQLHLQEANIAKEAERRTSQRLSLGETQLAKLREVHCPP